MDGEAPPKPRLVPKPKAKPKPGDAPEQDKDGDKQPKKPLVTPSAGFQQAQGRATGVVLTADGWILVARFALALEPTTILVTVPGVGTFPATRAGEDTSRGLALVKIDASGLPVLAVDIPSGLCSDTGKVQGACITADLTVTFIGRKIGLAAGKGAALCGKLVFDDLGVPQTDRSP